ncbi:iron-sulfur cluster repair di-iron protein [Marixanthomonas spongiae]|uniref:Iron-sulfur cluster repair di-iron protein n=1 Tax=Marixanthomonas spongiae TaxID=2174845 RepID=A0A2U0I3X7_9FLAO|nr:iron-sulfur cluster repair di-iron protein [Marixanthomonas spongiae]PVW15816.1 iron-sulfur cluster repair di-iron protein [Marixanthomonas spongiae]
MSISEEKTIADIVAENIKTSHIFKKHGIDFCCGGGITVQKACEKKGIDYNILAEELHRFDMNVEEDYDYLNWPLDVLIDHIVAVHHIYVAESIPLLLQYVKKVAKVHGHHYTELLKIRDLFIEVSEELSAHMKKEEMVLFPFIKNMVQTEKEGGKLDTPHFRTVENPIAMMESEHEDAGDIFKEIARLTNNYTPPEGACNTFRALYDKLEEFEQDLHTHIHLENNILHPKALKLEKALRN